MTQYKAKEFSIGALDGLSAEQLDVHLKLYAGYVTHANLINEKLADLASDPEKNAYTIAELRRRFAFEFDGMRMHEYYFEQFEGGMSEHDSAHALSEKIHSQYGGAQEWETHFRSVAATRGIGWVVMYQDPRTDTLVSQWVGDHELGQLAGLNVLVALDMWEHAFMVDYTPAEKKQYIDAFFKNFNWGVVEGRLL